MLEVKKLRLFQKTATAVLLLFFGIMIMVTLVAYARPSGSTGLDMSKVHKLRLENKKS